MVELHLPAVRAVVADTLHILERAGARMALPGEFTRRALLNGRISMAQAEAVGALIKAHSADEARMWAARTAGHARGAHARIGDDLQALLAELELGLDFSLEDVELLPRAELARRLAVLARRLQGTSGAPAAGEAGWLWSGEPRVVLAGLTNAGKSTLFNALLARPAALVSPHGHTTRDPLEARWEAAPNVRVALFDTAGLETAPPADELSCAIQDATRRALRAADVLLLTMDRSVCLDAELLLSHLDEAVGERPPPVVSVVWTKCDLAPAPDWTGRGAALEAELARRLGRPPAARLEVAAAAGEGVDAVRECVAREAGALRARLAAAWAAGETAARSGAERAAAALARAQAALRDQLGEDAVAVELREAVHALSDAQGLLLRHDALTDALLDRIFSNFCVGK